MQHCLLKGLSLFHWMVLASSSKITWPCMQGLISGISLQLHWFICLSLMPEWFFFFFGFLGPHLQHVEVSRLGVKSELQLPARATAHSNARSLTHWVRLGIKPASLWILDGFINRWAMKGTPQSDVLTRYVFFLYTLLWLIALHDPALSWLCLPLPPLSCLSLTGRTPLARF